MESGELVALMGASGSGKSTLMNILGCLDRPSSGEYWLDGHEISQLSSDQRALVRNRMLGFVFQSFNLLPRTSALENVAMPLSYSAENLSDREAGGEPGTSSAASGWKTDWIMSLPNSQAGSSSVWPLPAR